MEHSYAFEFETALDHYTADAFVVRCIDDRFWKAFKQFLKSLGMEHIDPESVAGGAKILASPEQESDRNFMLREIEKSVRLHGTRRIMLCTHSDCGAYGGLARFNGNADEEFAFHRSEHQRACAAVAARFPGLAVESYFIDPHGVIKTT